MIDEHQKTLNVINNLWCEKAWHAITKYENDILEGVFTSNPFELASLHVMLATAYANMADKQKADTHVKLAIKYGFSNKTIARIIISQDFSVLDNSEKLNKQIMFMKPDYLATSAWIEHIPFAFWLVEALKPRSIVELGSHYGVSYFAFCQAVKHLRLSASTFAVDTWQGDDHAGFYSDDIYHQVSNYNNTHFSEFSTLLRQTFDEANEYFSDKSIDLLHIDGLHTYEAVNHDFVTWLPKMSRRGIVILHDTNVRTRGFGVFKLIEELKQKYPVFEFLHGYGLAVVAVGDEINNTLLEFFNAYSANVSHNITEQFSYLGKACLHRYLVECDYVNDSDMSVSQIYIPDEAGNYSEENAVHQEVLLNKEQDILFEFVMPIATNDVRLRFDPADISSLIVIKDIKLVEFSDDSEHVLFEGVSSMNEAFVQGDALILNTLPNYYIYACANDPIILLPPINVAAGSLLRFRIRMLIATKTDVIREAWREH